MSKKDCICWTCQNATGGCSWSKSFELVKGCTYQKTLLKISPTNIIPNYFISKCPQYKADTRQEINIQYIALCLSKITNKSIKTIIRYLSDKKNNSIDKLKTPKTQKYIDLYKAYLLDKTI